MSKEKKRQFAFLVDELIEQDIDIIQREMRMTTKTQAVRYAIGFTARKLLPEYVRVKKLTKNKSELEKEKERLVKKAERDVALEELKEKEQNELLEKLNGKKIMEDNGLYSVEYETYEKVGKNVLRGTITVPFGELKESHVESQYKGGTPEEIKKLL